MHNQQNKFLPYLMWFFPVIFFAYQFILRLWPGLMMNQIMEQFTINASSFGFMASLYYYGYSSMQIPVAILLEKYGARLIIFIFASICGIATFIFIYTNNCYLAFLARFLVGVGSAVGFLGVSKVISEWFPAKQYAKMVGYSFTFGLMGAIYGGKPVSILIENYSWQKVASSLAWASILIGICTYLFLRSNSSHKLKHAENTDEQFKASNFISILSLPSIWLLAIANFLMVGALEGFADVWGVQYLSTAYNLPKGEAAALTTLIFGGMIFGGPILAFLSHKFGNYIIIILCGFGMAIAFAVLLMQPVYNWYILAIIFILIGIMCSYQVLVFSAGADLVKPKLLGVTIAFLNCMNMLGGSFFHTSIGYLMDLCSMNNISDDNLKKYSIENFSSALAIIPICSIMGSLIVIYMKRREVK